MPAVASPVSSQRRSILLTGHRGYLARWLQRSLKRAGYSVVGFDFRDGNDIRDADALVRAASRTVAIVHCAVLSHLSQEPDEVMFGINTRGTENVLCAAESAGHSRVIVFSSSQVFGLDHAENVPHSFPIRDNFPLLAGRPYGASKVAAEELCEAFTARTGIATLCLRPPHIWVPGHAREVRNRWARFPEQQWTPFWNFGAFIDVRDVSSAVALGLTVPLTGHHRVSLCAADIAAMAPARQMTERLLPGVPWDPDWPPANDPSTALFDTTPAQKLLGWRPEHTWAATSHESPFSRIRRRARDPFPP